MAKRYQRVTVEGIQNTIQLVGAYASSGDWEAAHAMADDLYRNVLKTIARKDTYRDGMPDELAKEALKVEKIKFRRECA